MHPALPLFVVIFTLSGFAGLIYESIWTHYLKLFLGHAAYAQTLVLAIFMGGMALGAWLCSRYSRNWPNLLRGYALAELAIGFCALVFHPFYTTFLDLAYDNVFPALGSPGAVTAFKWSAGTLLILPQSILLGMTFPLMTAGVIRLYPQRPGETVAALYFGNSLGAAIGVLASGFVLIGWLGLPGTITLVGLLNICLALWVWRLSSAASVPIPPVVTAKPEGAASNYLPYLLVALITGMASFLYEIGWIRMLTLVLGASTHAFELMLSAFIAGLALGGLWIRSRIERIADPRGYLGKVQIFMGLLALATLPMYGQTFELMRWLLNHLDKTETGYTLFNLGSHGIALAVMLPATFCAGMTLPLITFLLLRERQGERSIGAVYAANTVGAILGVLLAVHVGLPMIGLKGVILLGAALDVALGIWLLWTGSRSWQRTALAGAFSCGAFAIVLWGVQLSPHQMASGVYRQGTLMIAEETAIPFHRDGKTATISVTRLPDGVQSIRTNGKTDAALSMGEGPPRPDEHTMILAGLLPMALHPEARRVANIGLGSGLTTHSLLGNPRLEQVDTIEIEPAVIEAIELFRPRVARALDDPRSKLHVEDAKSFFSSHQKKYDIIISEPSNPWVSGVSGLFSEEFYARIKPRLNEGGLLVQWLQLYEIDLPLVATVFKALAVHFEDYDVYAANNGDLIIVARPQGRIPPLNPWLFEEPALAEPLRRLSIHGIDDLEVRWVANKQVLAPLIESYTIRANSDYDPVLDQGAARARFMSADASGLLAPDFSRLGGLRLLGGHERQPQGGVTVNSDALASVFWGLAQSLYDYRHTQRWVWDSSRFELPPQIINYAELGRQALACNTAMPVGRWLDGMYNSVAKRMIPYLDTARGERLLRELNDPACQAWLDPLQRHFTGLLTAIVHRDAVEMSASARRLLGMANFQDPEFVEYLVSAGMQGDLLQKDRNAAQKLLLQYTPALGERRQISLSLRLLAAHSGVATP